MSKITNVRLPNAARQQYEPSQFDQLVRSLEQVIFQLNNTYSPIVTENKDSAYAWYGDGGGSMDMSGLSVPVSLGGTSLDAFGRLRVSEPYTLFDSQNRYAVDNQFDVSTTGTGTTSFLSNEAAVKMEVTAGGVGSVLRRSYRSFPYQPGKSLLVLATFVMDSSTSSNLTQRVGYFNTQNGVFFQRVGSVNSFVLRSSSTPTPGTPSDVRTVAQANWNGDKLDGTGASGYTLDVSKAQILFMDFEWLGVGSVRCGFIINGEYIVCHTFNNANDISSVYMTTAILPMGYQIISASALAASMKAICCSVVSEGGFEQTSIEHVARRVNATSASTITTSFYPIASIRLASGALGAVVIPSSYNFLPTTSDNYEIALIKNTTLTSPSWTAVPSDANVEFDISSTAMTGGTIASSSFTTGKSGAVPLSAGSAYNLDLQLGASIAGVSDIYTLAARVVTTGGAGSGGGVGSLSFYDLTQ
ncbi:MAG: hypothetical protein EBU08_05995 [Micrococcales bacterium]|nr:hypothetical protein [Micrococcales bacterium]